MSRYYYIISFASHESSPREQLIVIYSVLYNIEEERVYMCKYNIIIRGTESR